MSDVGIVLVKVSATISELREELSKAAQNRDYNKFESIMSQLAAFKRVQAYYSEKNRENYNSCESTSDQAQS